MPKKKKKIYQNSEEPMVQALPNVYILVKREHIFNDEKIKEILL